MSSGALETQPLAPMDLDEKKEKRRLIIESDSDDTSDDDDDKQVEEQDAAVDDADEGSSGVGGGGGGGPPNPTSAKTKDPDLPHSAAAAAAARGAAVVVRPPPARLSSTSAPTTTSTELFSPELLHQYYSRLFPFDLLCSWLSYQPLANNSNISKPTPSPSVLFSRREFSMTIEPSPGDEIYIRYQSFAGPKELTDAVLKRRPVKIDLGAVFSHPPKDHKSVPKSAFQPVQRELVFDIDLTDYDEVRACGCAGASICHKCWDFMKMAVKVLDEGLRIDFGFQHIGWFYSGRRGVHCWVCDETARDLTDAGRSAVASYFEVQLASDKNRDVQLAWPLHPMLERAYEHLEPVFVRDVIPNHKLFATPEQWNALLESLPESAQPVKEHLREEWNRKRGGPTSPEHKWTTLKKHLSAFIKNSRPAGNAKFAKTVASKDLNKLEAFCPTLVFTYAYPRLDVNVSKMRNHLLKSPFCVHPKTGRVCVPFLASEVDDFDPFQVPTLPQLLQEIDAYDRSSAAASAEGGGEGSADRTTQYDWQKTSLKPYFDKFQKNFLEPMLRDLRTRTAKRDRDLKEKQAAETGDF